MPDQGVLMNAEYSAYSDKLMKYIKLNIFMMLIILAVVIIFAIVLSKQFKGQRAVFYLMPGAIAVCALIYITSVHPYVQDIKNNDYIEYNGEFFVEQENYSGRGPTRVLIRVGDKEKSVRYKNSIEDTEFKDGSLYSGVLVWSKRSKVLVDFKEG